MTSRTCPTCHSANPDFAGLKTEAETLVSCSDPWHTGTVEAEKPKNTHTHVEDLLITHTASVGDLYRQFDQGKLEYPAFNARLKVLEKLLGDSIITKQRTVEVEIGDGEMYQRGYQAGYHAGIRKKSQEALSNKGGLE